MPCSEEEIKSGGLLIRRDTSDGGGRPIEPCTNFWRSPDIWIEGGIDPTTARVGVANTVKVRVHNISGSELRDVNVQAWVCDYTLGVGPAFALNPPGDLTGFVGSIAPGGNQEVTCSPTWTPTAGQAALNGGHVCLAANCYAEDPVDGAILVAPNIIKVCCDSHHGQRNIAVRAAPQGGGGMARMTFRMFAANVDPKDRQREFVILLQEQFGAEGFGADEKELIAAGPYARLPIQPAETRSARYHVRGAGCLEVLRPKRASEYKVSLAGGVQIPLIIEAEFDPKEPIGTVHTFDVTQRDATTGEITGGARILAVITP